MRLTFWAALIGLGMIYFGGTGLYTYFTASEKQTITIEELIAGGPATGWYEITGAHWNELETLYQEDDKTGIIQSDGMLVLVRPQGTDRMAPVQVLLQQEGAGLAGKVSKTRSLNQTISRAELLIETMVDEDGNLPETFEGDIEEAIAASEEADAIFMEHERTGSIEGLVTTTAPGSWTRGEILSTSQGGVDSNFVVGEPGYEPNVIRPAVLLGGGILLLLVVGAIFLAGGRTEEEHYE